MQLKTTKIIMSAVVLFGCFTVNAQAVEISPYASFKINYGQIKADGESGLADGSVESSSFNFDSTFNSRIAAGASLDISKNGALRVELEYSDTTASFFEYTGTIAGGGSNEEFTYKLQSKTLLLNTYFDVNTGTILTPYIGLGAGVNHASLESNFKAGNFSTPTSIVSDWLPVWNIGVGVGVQITEALTLDIGYRYTDLGKLKGQKGLYWNQAGVGVWRVGEIVAGSRFTSHEGSIGLRYNF